MPPESRRVLTIRYRMTDAAGSPLDSADAGRPLSYLEGTRRIVAGLERALEEKAAGDQLIVDVPAADAHGPRDGSRIRTVARGKLPDKVAAGARCRVQVEEGYLPALVTAVDADTATVDLNHPLAGVALRFEVEVLAIRDATADELSHGHAHGVGGAH